MNDLTLYNSIKDQMKTGDLLQWESDSFIGWAIRLKTNSNVNHSSVVIKLAEYEGLERRRFTDEALEHGVVLNYLSRRLENHAGHCWWYPLTDSWDGERQLIGERAMSFIGIPYDYDSLFKQLVGSVSADATKLFCSETCFLSYGFSGKAPNPGQMPSLGIFKEPIQIL
jgi:hypothetical protein